MKENKNWRVVYNILAFCLMGLVISFCAGGQGTVVEKGVIQSDTTWKDQIFVKGDVEIAKGVTLTVMPGTIIRFAKIEAGGPANLYLNETDYFDRAELIVRGRLIAKGTKNKMIRFTSAERSSRPGDWGAINFQDSSGNIFEYCDFSYADTAVHGHGVQAIVDHCNFHDNGVAVGYKNIQKYGTPCVFSIKENRIVQNGGGVLCGNGSKSVIAHNEISDNKLYGIFGKKPHVADVKLNNISGNGKAVLIYASKGFRMRENNITGSTDYHISLLEGQKWDVDATGNWWGTKDADKIKKMIWDRAEERSLGRVNFSSMQKGAVQNAGLTG